MMKKYMYRLFCPPFVGATMIACAEDYMETDKGHDTLTLSMNQQELMLNEKNHSQEALALSQTTGTSYRSGSRISYTLGLAKAGAGFANPYSVDLGTRTYQWTKRVEKLNQFLNTQFGVGYAVKAELGAHIIAVVTRMEDQKQIATAAFTATTYQPVTTTPYLVGDTTPGEWNVDNTTAMERIGNGQFTWAGELNVGSLKFITTLEEFLPSCNRDTTAGEELKLIYRTSSDQPDGRFTISKGAIYVIKTNLLDLTLTLAETENIGWRYEEFLIVGSSTGNGDWGFEVLSEDTAQMGLFHYEAVVSWKADGGFKFTSTADFGQADALFHPTVASAPYTSTSVVLRGDDDAKWQMKETECGEPYKVWFYTGKGKEKMLMRPFTPYEGLYLVDEATPNGQDLDDAAPMTRSADSPYIFIWSGTLKTGEMEIPYDKQLDWNGDWFMTNKNNKTPAGEVETALSAARSDAELSSMYPDIDLGSLDYKWNIQGTGSYRITIDQLKETVSIVKQQNKNSR